MILSTFIIYYSGLRLHETGKSDLICKSLLVLQVKGGTGAITLALCRLTRETQIPTNAPSPLQMIIRVALVIIQPTVMHITRTKIPASCHLYFWCFTNQKLPNIIFLAVVSFPRHTAAQTIHFIHETLLQSSFIRKLGRASCSII